MTAFNVLSDNVGKRPEEIVNALYRAGFAVVPLAAVPGTEGTRILNITKPFAEIFEKCVEHARVKA
jgi:hypothetical protein